MIDHMLLCLTRKAGTLFDKLVADDINFLYVFQNIFASTQ